jgi:GT2 family glycosyltransferase
MHRTLIAVPSIGVNDFRFTLAFASLKKPPGTGIEGVMRSQVDVARNAMAKRALEFNYDSVLFLDDDMIPPPALLEALVAGLEARPDLSALCPMAYRRKPPHYPCAMRCVRWPKHEPIEDINAGIVVVDSITFAATLVRTEVFRKVPFPWFEFSWYGSEWIGEDVMLSAKMLKAGMKLGCDTSLEVGHIAEGGVIGRSAWEVTRPAKLRAK